ncbi:MAG: nicotinate-nucleotide adenylyltransferase [Verrucomicrobia bacterium]|nr:nicotinate-nucleotide adenylyltransferase [Verrucomicrobiota bacterium]
MNPAGKKSRIGILGGTFNPIHVGHMILAQSALEAYELSSVIFMPCATPAHKGRQALLSGKHRLAMVERAIGWNPFFEVSDVELQRTGVSYAVDTVSVLTRQRPQAQLFFIIGTDTLLELHKWRSVYDLLALCRFITFGRPGPALDALGAKSLNLDPPWPERLMKDVTAGRLLDVSSTDIRYRVAEGLSIRYLVPPEVEMYIAEHRLFRR